MSTRVQYTCCRCGYAATDASHMRTHLYKKKKLCAGSINAIVLTDEIKQCIMINRIYKVPSLNTIMLPAFPDCNNSLQLQSQSQNASLARNLDNIFDFHFQDERKRLEADGVSELQLQLQLPKMCFFYNFFRDVVDLGFAQCSIVFDPQKHEVSIYNDNAWNIQQPFARAVHVTVQMFCDYFLYTYELALVKVLETEKEKLNDAHTQDTRTRLDELYEFYAAMGMEPYVFDKTNNELLFWCTQEEHYAPAGLKAGDYRVSDKYTEIFMQIKRHLTLPGRDRIRSRFGSLLRQCTKRSNIG